MPICASLYSIWSPVQFLDKYNTDPDRRAADRITESICAEMCNRSAQQDEMMGILIDDQVSMDLYDELYQ